MPVNTQDVVIKYKSEKKVIMPFFQAYEHLKLKDAGLLRNTICELCGISSAYFTMKKNGKRGITEQEKKTIEMVFRCFGIDAFTGEPIKKVHRYENIAK